MSAAMVLVLAAALAAAIAAAVAVFAARSARAARRRPDPEALRGALLAGYEHVAPPEAPRPLRWPEGLIEIGVEGIALHLGGPGVAPDFRWVRWDRVRHVGPAGEGAIEIHVAGVGSVVASGAVGGDIVSARGRSAG